MKIGFILLVLLTVFISGCYQNYKNLEIASSNSVEQQKNVEPEGSQGKANDLPQGGTKHEKEDEEIDLPSCGDKKELFSIPPLKLEDFTNIIPLGNLAPSAHVIPTPHLYLSIRKENPSEEDGMPASVPVYAPADITITEIELTEALNKPDFTDSGIKFYVCKEFKAYFDHVKNLNPKIKEAFDKAPTDLCHEYTLQYGKEVGAIDWKFCRKNVNVIIEAGEQIGTAGGGSGQKAFDFGAFDYRIKPHVFANPNTWRYKSDLYYVVCGLDYFAKELKNELKSRLGKGGMLRQAEPVCGEVVQDIPGTLQGNWIPKGFGNVGEDNPYLALVHDNLDPSKPVFSVGTYLVNYGMDFGVYYFDKKRAGLISRDFGDVKDDQVYCYENFKNERDEEKSLIILVQLVNKDELRIEGQNKERCGNSWKFTDYAEFRR